MTKEKRLPERKSPKTTPPKKEIQTQERALLKANRKRQRELKQREKELRPALDKSTRGSVKEQRLEAELSQVTKWLRQLKAEETNIKNPPTPRATEKAYEKYNANLDAFIASLSDPSKSLRQIEQAFFYLGTANKDLKKSESVINAFESGGVAAEIQAYFDAKDKAVSDLADTKVKEEAERSERQEAKTKRPPVSPKPASDPLGYWSELPRGIQGIANVTSARLSEVAQDIADAAGLGASDFAEMASLIHLDRQNAFGGNLTGKERSRLNSLLKKSQPKKAVEELARTLELAHTVDRYLQKIKGRRYNWDDWVGRQYITTFVQGALYRLAKDHPLTYKVLGADLGLAFPSERTLSKMKYKKPHDSSVAPPRPKARRKPRWYHGR